MATGRTAVLDDLLAHTEREWGRPLARFDPANGGTDAEVLLLRRDPRCRVREHPVVSLDSGHPADANLRRAVTEAGLDRARLAVWHLAPFYLEDPDGPPRGRAWEDAVALAGQLWPLLPAVRTVVLLGGDTQRAWRRFSSLLPAATVVAAPHPSPLAWHRRGRGGVRNAELVVAALRDAVSGGPGPSPLG